MRRKKEGKGQAGPGRARQAMLRILFVFYFSIIETLVQLVFKNEILLGEDPKSAFHSEKNHSEHIRGSRRG